MARRLPFTDAMLQHAGCTESVVPLRPLPRRIVALGGGTGLPAVLRSLRRLFGDDLSPDAITAIVAVSDEGGSSGRLRNELRILPPGDVRNCLAALTDEASPLTRLLQHRMSGGNLDGHAVGNLLLAALTQQLDGDFVSAVDTLGRMVGTAGRVLPATAEQVRLKAEFASGDVIVGEQAIATAGRGAIRRLSLEHRVRPLPQAVEALVNADVIIVGPGSLYTSLLPVLLVDGVAPTIYGLRATRVCVANLMTEPGETEDYSLERHLDVIEHHVGVPLFDYVLANSAPISPGSLERYARNCAHPVRRRGSRLFIGSARIVERELAWEVENGKLRHDPRHLARALSEIIASSHAAMPERMAVGQ
ncbi:MAG: gluconeogenesis factor YvcK family protein [Vicinamibacterales bacterium]